MLFALALLAIGLRARSHLGRGTEQLLAVISSYVGLPVRAQSIAASWWPPGVIVTGVRIADESRYGPGDLARADEAELRVAWWPLVRGRLRVREVRLLRPRLRVVRGADRGWNLPNPVRTSVPRAGAGGPGWLAAEVLLDTIRVRDGWVSYSDAAVPGAPEIELDALNLLLKRDDDGYEAGFNARALGGPEANVQGQLWVPHSKGEGDAAERFARLEMRGTELAGVRLPAALALLGGELPFGVEVRGDISGSVEARIDASWPPRQSEIQLDLDASGAAVEAAHAWIRKKPGTPASLTAHLRATRDDLLVDDLELKSAGATVVASSDPSARDEPDEMNAQIPLQLSAQHVSADALSAWVPVLARLGPRGDVSLQGRLGDARGEASLAMSLTGRGLTVTPGDDEIELGTFQLSSEVGGNDGPWIARASIGDARGEQGLSLRHLEASLGGGRAQPGVIRIAGADAGRGSAHLESLSVEGALTDAGADLPRLEIRGLGGALLGSVRVSRGRGGRDPAEVSVEASWRGVELSGLLDLLGLENAQGKLQGRTHLVARAQRSGPGEEFSVTGDFDASLDDGSLPGVNPAGAALARLDVPGLGGAVARHGRARVPDLFAANSTIESLHATGTIVDRELTISALRLSAPSYTVDAKGHVTTQGAVDLSGSLALTPAATAALVEAEPLIELLSGRGRPIRFPIAIRGNYPDLDVKPEQGGNRDGNGGSGSGRALLDRLLPGGAGILSP